MILVVCANSNTCRIYHYQKKSGQLLLQKTLQHPESKLKNAEISSDKAGRYQGYGGSGAFSPANDPKEVEFAAFSREIAKILQQETLNNDFRIIIIAPAQMLGLLNQHIDKNLQKRIQHTFKKDLIGYKEHELRQFLDENTPFPVK